MPVTLERERAPSGCRRHGQWRRALGQAREQTHSDPGILVSHIVHKRSTELEFRLGPGEPTVGQDGWQDWLSALEEINCGYLVASGSRNRLIPDVGNGALPACRCGANL